ncbi:MAG: hypothetical protein ACU0AU_13750 [Cognatishimia activa]
MFLVDGDAVLNAAINKGCNSPEALKKKFGGGHEGWKKLLSGGPVSEKVFERACSKLQLDEHEIQVKMIFKRQPALHGLGLNLSQPTLLDFRSQFDPRPEANGKGKDTVYASGNRLFLLFSYLELHVNNEKDDIFVEYVRLKVEIGGETQIFHPYRWCSITDSNNSETNPEGYWLGDIKQGPTWTETPGPEGFYLGKHGTSSIKQECSFVAFQKGNLQHYCDLLYLLESEQSSKDAHCTLIVKFRNGSQNVIRTIARAIPFSVQHLQKSKKFYEEKFGYAPILQAVAST